MERITLCPRCQKRNPAEAARCQYCGALMAPAPASAAAPPHYPAGSVSGRAPTSGMATASLVLGLLGFFTLGLTALIGLILGIVGLRQIGRSQGQMGGQGLALAGIIVSGLVFLMGFLFLPIMAAILFPVFAQAREKARAAVCMSNLRQLGAAMSMYEQDYDGHLPRRQNWCDGVLPYVRTPQGRPAAMAFQCPSLPNQPDGYAYNGLLSGISNDRLASPYKTAVLFDALGQWNLAGGPNFAAPRHNGGVYMLFADGSTRWLRTFNGVVWKPRPSAPPAGRRHTRRRRSRSRRE